MSQIDAARKYLFSVLPSTTIETPPTHFKSGWKIVSTITPHITRCGWSPIVWSNARRLQKDFVSADFLVLDFDNTDGEYFSYHEAISRYKDYACIIGTTRSSSAYHHRFRIAIPFSERIVDRDVYLYNMRNHGEEHADKQCKDAARYYYPCKEIVFCQFTGESWDVKIPPPKKRAVKKHYYPRGCMRGWVMRWLRQVEMPGQRNCQAWRVACDLFRANFSETEVLRLLRGSATFVNLDDGDAEILKLPPTVGSAKRYIEKEMYEAGRKDREPVDDLQRTARRPEISP